MSARLPDFRPGNVLATSFTGTLSERHGTPVERIPTPQRLTDWLNLNGLAVPSCTPTHLDLARELRESIHLAATAAALGHPLPPSAIRTINTCSAQGRPTAHLTPEGHRQWLLTSPEDAFTVIATDAIALLTGERHGHLSLCASPTCQAAFLDTSQSHTRRWCDMNTCGNRQKKARFKATRTGDPRAGHKVHRRRDRGDTRPPTD